MTTFNDKVKGCLAGLAVGDALGMPVETMTREEILTATKGLGIVSYADPVQRRIRGTRGLPAGTTTDDTQLTLAVARSLIRCGALDREDQAKELVREFCGTTFGWGRTTTSAARDLGKWFAARGREGRHPCTPAPPPAKPGAGCGNGVAMKVAPLAVMFPCGIGKEMEPFLTYTMELGLMTHGDPRASFGAAAIGAAVSAAIRSDGTLDTEDAAYLKERIDCAAAVLEHRYRFFRHDAENPLSRRLRLAWCALDGAESLFSAVGAGCFTLESVPFALGVFLRHPRDFRAGVLEAVNAGGDTDTTGAMVGAMIGANVGIGGIPQELLEGLRQKSYVLEVADALADAATSPTNVAHRYWRLLY